jgi:23S rRNA (adenine2503-C2)-methyltransferase
MSVNFFDLSSSDLQAWLQAVGQPKYRAQQLAKWVHQRRVLDPDLMTDLPANFRAKLKEEMSFTLPRIVGEHLAQDGTCKWLIGLADGNAIETVYIPEKTRGTLCVSSQVGCALNCRFCATGKEGFNRNLSLSEIIGQLWIALEYYPVTNVVMMGMGEPLLNFGPVSAALEWMLSDVAYGLSKYRVTVSTSGVIPQMLALKEALPVSLAVSLHAADNTLRNHLVPLNKKYPLEQLIPVCRDYFKGKKKQKVLFEYVMLSGVNDSPAHAKALVRLLANVPCKVNLIPFNPFPDTEYTVSSPDDLSRFCDILVSAGFHTRVRRTRGEDVDAACGQLAGDFHDRTGRHQRWLKKQVRQDTPAS